LLSSCTSRPRAAMVRLSVSCALLALSALPLASAGPLSFFQETSHAVVRSGLRNILRLNETQIDRILATDETPLEPHPFACASCPYRSPRRRDGADLASSSSPTCSLQSTSPTRTTRRCSARRRSTIRSPRPCLARMSGSSPSTGLIRASPFLPLLLSLWAALTPLFAPAACPRSSSRAWTRSRPTTRAPPAAPCRPTCTSRASGTRGRRSCRRAGGSGGASIFLERPGWSDGS